MDGFQIVCHIKLDKRWYAKLPWICPCRPKMDLCLVHTGSSHFYLAWRVNHWSLQTMPLQAILKYRIQVVLFCLEKVPFVRQRWQNRVLKAQLCNHHSVLQTEHHIRWLDCLWFQWRPRSQSLCCRVKGKLWNKMFTWNSVHFFLHTAPNSKLKIPAHVYIWPHLVQERQMM